MSLPKTLQQLKQNDPRIAEIWDERVDDNGYWIYFVPGWINELDEVHCIHEMTVRECLEKMKSTVPCDCPSCVNQGRGRSA